MTAEQHDELAATLAVVVYEKGYFGKLMDELFKAKDGELNYRFVSVGTKKLVRP